MDVILMEKIVNLGQLGDIVKVKNGYARNFLIPQGKARRATQAALTEFQSRRGELEKAENEKLVGAQELAQKLDGLMLQIVRKAGVDGKLFGSVTNIDVAEALKGQGFHIAKSTIRMPQGPIKQIGDYALNVALHSDVLVHIAVSVLAET
jgi:large subunit ribosomal protein L9